MTLRFALYDLRDQSAQQNKTPLPSQGRKGRFRGTTLLRRAVRRTLRYNGRFRANLAIHASVNQLASDVRRSRTVGASSLRPPVSISLLRLLLLFGVVRC